jgi:hypothetical protein
VRISVENGAGQSDEVVWGEKGEEKGNRKVLKGKNKKRKGLRKIS